MEGVTISKYGLFFVFECLKRYFGESWEIAAFCAAGMVLSGIMLLQNRGKKENLPSETKNNSRYSYISGQAAVTKLNLVLFVILALTVYNPFLVRIVVPKLGMTPVYYRVFWAFPFVPGAAYYLTETVFFPRRKTVRAVLAAAAIAAAALLMPVNPGVRYHLQMPTNIYKVYGSIPVICDAIHEDFEKSDLYKKRTEKAENTDILTRKGARAFVRTLPRCVFPYDMEFQVRQYDASVCLTFSRNMRLYYEGNRSTGITYSDASKAYQRRKVILDAMYGRDPSISAEQFREAMNRTKTNYLVVENTEDDQNFLSEAGCVLIGDEAGYHIYSYGLT